MCSLSINSLFSPFRMRSLKDILEAYILELSPELKGYAR